MAQLYGSRPYRPIRIMGVTGENQRHRTRKRYAKPSWSRRPRNEAQIILNEHFAQTDPETNKLRKQLDELRKSPQAIHNQRRVIAQRKGNPRKTHVFRRGEFKQPLHEVERMASACCIRSNETSIKPETGSTLPVGWLTRRTRSLRESSSTKRGPTSSDMGSYTRGLRSPGRASHSPSAYGLAGSSLRPQGQMVTQRFDPFNRSFGHLQAVFPTPPRASFGSRQRTPAPPKPIPRRGRNHRDLNSRWPSSVRKVGGASVFPPAGRHREPFYANSFKWNASKGTDRYRRGLYTFSSVPPPPQLTHFDCPDSSVACVKRHRSNTPLAALVTLSATFVEAAKAFAQRILKEAHQRPRRIAHGFRLRGPFPPTPRKRKPSPISCKVPHLV